MNILQPWNAVFLAGFVCHFGIRHRLIQRTKHEKKAVRKVDGVERLLLAAMYFVRTPREERLMLETFGDEYRRYSSQTGRVFPRLKSR